MNKHVNVNPGFPTASENTQTLAAYLPQGTIADTWEDRVEDGTWAIYSIGILEHDYLFILILYGPNP